MSEDKERSIVPREREPGFFQGLSNQFRLILRLMGDRRVNPLIKVLPVGTLVYLIFPDLLPGPLDDAVVIGLGTYVFVELCPPDVVEEHRAALRVEAGARGEEVETNTDEIVEGEFTEAKDA